MAKRLDVFVRGTFEVGRSGVSALEVVSSQRFLRASLGAGHPTAQLYLRASCLLASRGNLTLQRPTSVDLPSGIFLASVSDAAAGGGVHLFLASANSRIVLLLLRQEEEVLINASVLLAFDPSVTIRSSTVQFRPAGSGGGGGGAVVMQGPGMVALTVRGAPLTVGVEPNLPILRVQPQMTLGWTTNILPPDLRPALMVADGATAGAAGRTE